MAHSDSYKTIENFFCETNRISALLPVDEPFIEPSPILSILRPYQLETVKWMVTRELQSTHIQRKNLNFFTIEFHILFTYRKITRSKKCFV